MSGIRRPVMLYHGAKFRMAHWIIDHLPKHRNYVEPFGGSAVVLLQKKPSYHEVYNDLNSEVVNVFRVLRDPGKSERLRKRVELTPFSREEFEKSYKSRPEDNDVERARKTIIRSFFGWGAKAMSHRSGFRASARKAHSTEVMGWNNYPPQIKHFHHRLKQVRIENRDALEVVQQQDGARTVFYVDPPYVPKTRNTKHRYEYDMDNEDHRELAKLLHSIEGMVLLSGYPSELYEELYGSWERFERRARTQRTDKEATECLWLNPAAVCNQVQQNLFNNGEGQ